MTEKDLNRRSVIIFICTHNSARSQMAEGYLRARHGDLFEVHSAGTEVREVNPIAVAIMAEMGIDISGHRSKLIDEFFDRKADVVVTVCDSAHQACTGTPRECLALFQKVRDDIIAWIDTELVPKYGKEPKIS